MSECPTRPISFPSNLWSHISSQAKDFLTRLLEPDPKSRIRSIDALHHSWLKREKAAANATSNNNNNNGNNSILSKGYIARTMTLTSSGAFSFSGVIEKIEKEGLEAVDAMWEEEQKQKRKQGSKISNPALEMRRRRERRAKSVMDEIGNPSNQPIPYGERGKEEELKANNIINNNDKNINNNNNLQDKTTFEVEKEKGVPIVKEEDENESSLE